MFDIIYNSLFDNVSLCEGIYLTCYGEDRVCNINTQKSWKFRKLTDLEVPHKNVTGLTISGVSWLIEITNCFYKI